MIASDKTGQLLCPLTRTTRIVPSPRGAKESFSPKALELLNIELPKAGAIQGKRHDPHIHRGKEPSGPFLVFRRTGGKQGKRN